MKLPDKYGVRLGTSSFKKVTSSAVLSVDYDAKENIVEIEYKNGNVYHYLNANKKEWSRIIGFIKKGEGLGTYINQVFKIIYNNNERNFYELIVMPEHLSVGTIK